jgi:hypothetical protein
MSYEEEDAFYTGHFLERTPVHYGPQHRTRFATAAVRAHTNASAHRRERVAMLTEE